MNLVTWSRDLAPDAGVPWPCVTWPAVCLQMICELNCHVALLREHLLAMGGSRDSPELRERIRRTRLDCMTSCKQTAGRLLPHIRK